MNKLVKINYRLVAFFLVFSLLAGYLVFSVSSNDSEEEPPTYIKWVEFNVPYDALRRAMNIDIETYDDLVHINWIEVLSYLACKNGGKWKKYKSSQIDDVVAKLQDGQTIEEIADGNQYFPYFLEAYTAVLGGMLGEYKKEVPDKNSPTGKILKKGYGMIAYSPIAEGYGYSHFDDFGNSRNYGYKRQHLGNDLVGSVGTPIVAVEGGTVEAIGWNQYGGWRIGIRSHDGKRSYYYAHLRKDRPYHCDLEAGSVVKPGQVIGYLGMTGYSLKENVNGMTTPHLHIGMQLVFNEVQKEGINQIWINMYHLVKLLYQNRATVEKNEDTNEYYRVYDIFI